MFVHKLTRRQVFAGLLLVGILLFTLHTITRLGIAGEQVDASWVEVFSDTFDTLDTQVWSISEWSSTGYQWGVTAYPGDAATDYGLWAAGGGDEGELQSWDSGTYPSDLMVTIAMAGPFTPTQALAGMRLGFDALNKVTDSDDVVTYGYSYDGINFVESQELPMDRTNWQNVIWDPATPDNRPIWIGFRFFNDGLDVDTGPLLDNVSLEFRYENKVYMPYVALQPTPTPTPTPTPIPVYLDDFSNPQSGWYTGAALRFNVWPRYPDGRWEEVAYMSYIPGHYQLYVPLTFHANTIGEVDSWFVWPAEKAPVPASFYTTPGVLPSNYCVETRAKLVKTEPYNLWWAHWGLVFGANADRTEIYSLQVNANHDFAVLYHENYLYPGDRQETLNGEVINIEHRLVEWSGNDYGTLIPTLEYNTLKAVVKGDQVILYINGVRLDQIDINIRPVIPPAQTIPGMPRAWVGVIGGSWEQTPVTVQYDYFKFATDALHCPELQ